MKLNQFVLLFIFLGITAANCRTNLQAQETLSGRPPKWIVPLQGQAAPKPAPKLKGRKCGEEERKLNPAAFIQVFEDTKGSNRLPIYVPDPETKKQHFLISADETSSIVISPDRTKLGTDIALNRLYITAKLASGDSSKDVTVQGYAEIGKDKSTMATQTGAAFQSATNIQAMILNMAYTVDDIIYSVYPSCSPYSGAEGKLEFSKWVEKAENVDLKKCTQEADQNIAKAFQENKAADSAELRRVRDRFRLFQPEIQAISDFFTQQQNLAIMEKIGTKVFWIDRESLKRVSQQYKDNLQTALDSKSTPDAQAHALQDLLERTKLVYQDFADLHKVIMMGLKKDTDFDKAQHTSDEWRVMYDNAVEDFACTQRKEAFEGLKDLLADGIISLADNKAKDGDRLTVTVESVPGDGSSGGISSVFEIAIKKYGGKIQWGPSLLFVRRLAVTDTEATPPAGSTAAPLNRVNFAPSPGVTFGWAYFKRGDSGWNKFARGLSPGIGMNVTFMNFNDPSFDLAGQKFVNTNGTNVQVGSGVLGSLFDNKLQFSYGWNLNVEKRRTYFGVGFGFIEVGKEVAKYIAK